MGVCCVCVCVRIYCISGATTNIAEVEVYPTIHFVCVCVRPNAPSIFSHIKPNIYFMVVRERLCCEQFDSGDNGRHDVRCRNKEPKTNEDDNWCCMQRTHNRTMVERSCNGFEDKCDKDQASKWMGTNGRNKNRTKWSSERRKMWIKALRKWLNGVSELLLYVPTTTHTTIYRAPAIRMDSFFSASSFSICIF